MLTFNKITIGIMIALFITSLFLYQNQKIQLERIENLTNQNNLLAEKLTQQSKSIKDFKQELDNNIKIIDNFNSKDNEIQNQIKELTIKYKNLNIKKELESNPKEFKEKINKQIKIEIKELGDLK